MIRVLFILILFCEVSHGGLIDPSNKDSQHIKYGEDFVYVGKVLCIDRTSKNIKYFGSCVAINDKDIITAAHIFIDKSDLFVVQINNKEIQIDSIIIHPEFDSSIKGQNDIAILKLKECVGLNWYPSLYKNKDEQNKICSLAGFGTSGNFLQGPTISDGKKRAGSNIIDKIYSGTLVCSPSFKKNTTQLEYIIYHGDSGGGLFIENELAGIHSFINRNQKNIHEYETETFHTRISNHIEWIELKTE
jgi:hypothetical protein